jgi:hypothetical protein
MSYRSRLINILLLGQAFFEELLGQANKHNICLNNKQFC